MAPAASNAAIVPLKEPSPVTFQCPMLNPSNYNTWAIKMEAIMDAQGLWDAIDRPADAAVDVKTVKRARAFILQALPEDILLQVADHRDAKDMWNALKTRYLGADRVQKARIQTLTREFELLGMKDTETIDDVAGRITELVTKIRSLGSSVSEATQVKKLLNTVPDRFLPIVASIEQYSDLESMPFQEAIGRLKTYEERVKPREQSKNQAGQLLLTKTEWQERHRAESRQSGRGRGVGQTFHRSRGRGRGRYGSRGRGAQQPTTGNKRTEKNDQPKDQNGGRDRKNLRCYNCD